MMTILFHLQHCLLLFFGGGYSIATAGDIYTPNVHYNKHYLISGAHAKTRGKERATPTQLIKIASWVLDALCGHAHRMCRALATAKACRKSKVTLSTSKEKKQVSLQLIIQC